MIAARDDSTSPTSVAAPADNLAHRPLTFGRRRSTLELVRGPLAITGTIRDTFCERGKYDLDEGPPEDAPPRSRDGTRHAGLPGLMHAPLLTDRLIPLTLARTTSLIRLPEGVETRARRRGLGEGKGRARGREDEGGP